MSYSKVNDPSIIEQLNKKSKMKVVDPNLLAQLNGDESQDDSLLTRLGNSAGEFNQFVEKIPRNLAIGLAEGGRNIANTPHNLANLVGAGEYVPNFAPPEYDYTQAFGAKEPATLSDKLIRGLAQYAPAFALPGANLGRAGETISSIPKVGGFLGEAASQAVPQAAFGVTQNQNPLVGAAEGGLGSLAGSAIGKGIEKGINALRPSQILRGELSPEELAKNLELTKGTETNLGEIIESPSLKRLYENVLPHVLGSGSEKTMQRNTSNILKKGDELLTKISGKTQPEDYGIKIQEALKQSAKDIEKVKNEKFSKVNDFAKEAKVTTDRSNLRNAAKEILHQIESDPDLSKFTNPSDIKLIKDIAFNGLKEANLSSKGKKTYEGNSNISGKKIKEELDPITGEPIKPIEFNEKSSVNLPKTMHPGEFSPITGKRIENKNNYSLKNTDILRGKIGEMAHEAFIKGEKPKGSIYQKLKQALEKDVDQAIKHSSSEQLKKAHKDAMQFYKNEYAPYEDPDIRKFIKQGGDPDLIISHFIKGGKNDRATLLTKLSKGLLQEPNGTKNLLAASYFSRAIDNDGKLNPLKLSTLYHNLGKNQRKALFGDTATANEFKNYMDLVNKNKEGFNLMFNPKTGARNTTLLSHIGTLITGGLTGSLPGFAGTLLASGLAGKGATKLLTSPKYREKLVNAMIKNKQIELPKNSLPKGMAVQQGLSGNDTEQKPLELELIGKRRKD
jgi:hypothetical protein